MARFAVGVARVGQSTRTLRRAWTARVPLFKAGVGCGVLAWASYGSGAQLIGLAPTEVGLNLALAAGAVTGLGLAWRASA